MNELKCFIGKESKVVVKEPGNSRTTAVHGHIEQIADGFLFIKTDRGIGCYNLSAIVAIKPVNEMKNNEMKEGEINANKRKEGYSK